MLTHVNPCDMLDAEIPLLTSPRIKVEDWTLLQSIKTTENETNLLVKDVMAT